MLNNNIDVNVNIPADNEFSVKKKEKFLDMISKAVGTWYKPIGEKREFNTKVFELNKMLELKEKYNNNPELNELFKRTANRILSEEIVHQNNIENVLDVAYVNIEEGCCINDDKHEDDWIFDFLNYSKQISNKDLQDIWGKLLAGCINNNSSVSNLTLNTLSKMTNDVAKKFDKIVMLSVFNQDTCLPRINSIISKYGIKDEDIWELQEFGLLSYENNFNYNINIDCGKHMIFKYGNNVACCSSKLDNSTKIVFPIYKFTFAGLELVKTLYNKNRVINNTYAFELLTEFEKYSNNNSIIYSMHNYISEGSCSNEDLYAKYKSNIK